VLNDQKTVAFPRSAVQNPSWSPVTRHQGTSFHHLLYSLNTTSHCYPKINSLHTLTDVSLKLTSVNERTNTICTDSIVYLSLDLRVQNSLPANPDIL
jgi:hypothetical protein